MNLLEDANVLYDGGTKAINGGKWKYDNQFYEMNHLLFTAQLQRDIRSGEYHHKKGDKFLINERGKSRYITNNNMFDKTVNHVISDEVLTPAISPFLMYSNSASQKGKGVSLFRSQIEEALHWYYRKYGDNNGWILIFDFSGYYPNIHHDKCLEILSRFLDRSDLDPETIATSKEILKGMLKSFELDVSRFSDEEIELFYTSKVDPMLNRGVNSKLLTGEKMLAKGVDIGSQPSQEIGITFPYIIDNYISIVRGMKCARYSDDMWVISNDRDELEEIMDHVRFLSHHLGLIINENKTHIQKISKPFRLLQIQYWLTDTGRVAKKINPKSITRERRKLKAYKRQLDLGKMDYQTIEDSFKSWIGCQWRYMSKRQIQNMSRLYFELFGKDVTWRKKHSRLCWLMAQRSKISN